MQQQPYGPIRRCADRSQSLCLPVRAVVQFGCVLHCKYKRLPGNAVLRCPVMRLYHRLHGYRLMIKKAIGSLGLGACATCLRNICLRSCKKIIGYRLQPLLKPFVTQVHFAQLLFNPRLPGFIHGRYCLVLPHLLYRGLITKYIKAILTQRKNIEVFDRTGILMQPILTAPPLRPAKVSPVIGSIGCPFISLACYIRFQQHRFVAITLPPISPQTPSSQ